MHSVLSLTKKPHVTELAQMKWLHDGLSCHNVKFQWEKKSNSTGREIKLMLWHN